MKIRNVVAVSVALFGLSISTAVYAAPVGLRMPVQAMFEKTKMVKFSLRNDSGAPLELKVGESVMTLDAGKTVSVKLAVGTRICANTATAKHEAGEVLAEVSSQLSEVTVGIK